MWLRNLIWMVPVSLALWWIIFIIVRGIYNVW